MKKKMLNRILSFLMILCLVGSLTLPALAAEYYLEDGAIHIQATSTDGGATQTQTVTQGETTRNDAAPVVTQRDSGTATSNNVTIESSGGATAVVTVENVNIDTGSDTSGGNSSPIDVVNGSQAVITISGENYVDAGHNVNGAYDHAAGVHVGDSAVVIQGDSSDGTADVLTVSNDATDGAGIGSNFSEAFSGELTIRDVTVNTTNSNIGSGQSGAFSGTLVIDGADMTVNGGREDAGIGAGAYGDFTEDGTILISGQSTIIANGDLDGAGIGTGLYGDYSGTVIVTEGSNVTATGKFNGAGIGSGKHGDYSGTVIVTEGSTVTAASEHSAGIGTGVYDDYSGTVVQETGSTITATGGNDGAGLGAYYSRDAVVEETVDLTQYPTAPAVPTPLPWNDAMFPKDPDPTPDPEPSPAPTVPSGTTPASRAPAYDEGFWANVEKQIRAAKKGDTITIDAAWRTTMPASIMEAIAETGVTLIIQWNGGEDITIDKPYDAEEKYTLFKLKELAELLAD